MKPKTEPLKNQSLFITEIELLQEVVTSKEAADILQITTSAIRHQVRNGNYKENEYRKTTGGELLFNRSAIIKRSKLK